MAMEADRAGLYKLLYSDYVKYAVTVNSTDSIYDTDYMLGAF